MNKVLEFRGSVRARAKRMLQNGFLTDQAMRQDLRAYADDGAFENDQDLDDSTLDRIAREEFDAATKEHRAAMASWPKVTDCDRLDAAFTELNAMGIIARHNWTCCSTCGVAQMPDEHRRLGGRINGRLITGYIFYHQQGADNAIDNAGVHINYGSTINAASDAEYEKQSLAIARIACDVLAKHGLKTSWDGSYQRRPRINLDWKRRGIPKDYVDCDGGCNGAPQATEPMNPIKAANPDTPATAQRPIERILGYAIATIAVLAAIAVVIPVAFMGVRVGNWVIHSVWLAVVLGAAALLIIGAGLTAIARLFGLNVQPFGNAPGATPGS